MTPPIPPDHTEASRVIVRAPNWLGDAVLALPAMAAIRRHFKDAHLTIAAPAGFADIFRETIDARPDGVCGAPLRRRRAVPEFVSIRVAVQTGAYRRAMGIRARTSRAAAHAPFGSPAVICRDAPG
jgi:hypothetical protein